jgi:hypothetical protein
MVDSSCSSGSGGAFLLQRSGCLSAATCIMAMMTVAVVCAGQANCLGRRVTVCAWCPVL